MQNHTEILQQQTSLLTEDGFRCSQGDSPAKTPLMPTNRKVAARAQGGVEQDLFGTCSEQSKKLDRNTWLPKTWQIFLKLTEGETSERSSPRWPEWGIMQNGEYVVRVKKVPVTTAQGSIWLLTPTASDCKRDRLSFPFFAKRLHRSAGALPEQLFRLFGPVPGRVNPRFLAWMMGYPEDWLDSR